MSEASVKLQMRRYKKVAIARYKKLGYTIYPSDNSTFCFSAVRLKETRWVRIAHNIITDQERKLVICATVSQDSGKEFYLHFDSGDWEIVEIK